MPDKSVVPYDIIKVFAFQTLFLPMGWIFSRVTNIQLRLLFSFILGNTVVYTLYGLTSLHIYSCILINLLILKFCNKSKLGRYAFIYNIAHNSIVQLYNQIFHYNTWKMDAISIPFMMLILKHVSFAYSYQDSFYTEEKRILENKKEITFKDDYYLYPENQVYIIREFTTYEYICYILFYPTIIGGPFIEFSDFKRFIEQKGEYENLPSTILPSIKNYVISIACLALFYLTDEYNKIEILIDYENKYSFLKKCSAFLLSYLYAVRYFGGFSLVQTGSISCGFAYEQETYILEKHKQAQSWTSPNTHENSSNKPLVFGKARMINIEKLTLLNEVEDFFRNWNISVHHFLKRNLYLRNISTPEQTKENPKLASKIKNKVSLQVFLFSAFWHGFYPSYLFVFFHFYFFSFTMNRIIKSLSRFSSGVSIIPKKYHVYPLRFSLIILFIPYHCIYFVALDYKLLFDLIVSTKCFMTLICAVIYLIVILLDYLFLAKPKAAEQISYTDKKTN